MKRLIAALLLLPALAWGQSNPNFQSGSIPSAAQWNSYFSSKADVQGGQITNGTFTGGIFNNPTLNNASWSGAVNFINSSISVPSGSQLQGTTWFNVGVNKALVNSGTLTPIFEGQIGTISGTITGPTIPSSFLFINGNDFADAHTTSNAPVLVRISNSYGNSSSMEGGRYALTVQSGLLGGTQSGNKAANVNPFYGVANFWQTVSNTEGGTGTSLTTAWGQAIAVNPQLVMSSAATDWLEGSLAEFDIAVQSGASVAKKSAIKIVPLPTDAVQGSVADAALKFGGATGAVGWKNLILFGGDISTWTGEGELIKAEYSNAQGTTPNTSNWGVDLLEDSFPAFASNGGAFRSQGFTVDGVGVVQIGKALFTPQSGGILIDPSGSSGVISSLNAAGSSCAVGDILLFGNNGRAIVATVSGTAVATTTLLNAPYDFSGSAPATLSATAYPSSLGPCAGVVFNMTWTAGTTINFGTGSATAINIGKSGTTTTITGTIKSGSSTGQSQTCTVNQAKTLIFTNGLLTGGTCNS